MNLGEADKILTLYTPNLGKFSTIAKGGAPTQEQDGRSPGAAHSMLPDAGAGAEPGHPSPNRRPSQASSP